MKKISKKIRKFFFRKENFFFLFLAVIMLVNLVFAGFIFSKINKLNKEVIGFNMQFIRLKNEAAETKGKIDNMQSILMRLQAQYYRLQTAESEQP